jgi:uroporphyrinogen-III synthase
MARRRPLAGRRVVVTRARGDAGELQELLRAAGAATLACPTIRIVPPVDRAALEAAVRRWLAPPRPGAAEEAGRWIVFTSAHAVASLADRLALLARPPAVPGPARLAAVGPKTAAALAAHGLEVDVVPAAFTAAALAPTLGEVAGQRILLPQADIADSRLAESLRARGAIVEAVVAYRTVCAEPEPAELAELSRGFDAVTFTSGSCVRGFLRLVDRHIPARLIDAACLAAIGPATAATARELGLRVAVQPAEHSLPALVAALITHYQRLEELAHA